MGINNTAPNTTNNSFPGGFGGLVSGFMNNLKGWGSFLSNPGALGQAQSATTNAQTQSLQAQHALNSAPKKGGLPGLLNLSPSQITSTLPQYAQNSPLSQLTTTGIGGNLNSGVLPKKDNIITGAGGGTIAPVVQPTYSQTGPFVGGPQYGGLSSTQIASANAAEQSQQNQQGGSNPNSLQGQLNQINTIANNTNGPFNPNAPGGGGTPTNGINPGASPTVPGLISNLLGTASAVPGLQGLIDQEQKQLGGIAGGQPGLPVQLQQGRAGAIQAATNPAIANLLTEQQQQIGAGESALGAVQPQGANALGIYNPGTGTYSQYGGGTGNGIGTAGTTLGNLGGAQNYEQTIVPAYNAASALKDNLSTFLQQNPNINPSSLNIGNQLNQWIQGGNLSIPQYPELATDLNELANTIAPIVGAPGSVTNFKQQIVNSFIDPTASVSSITSQLNNLWDNIITPKMNAYAQTFGVNAPSGSGGNTQSNNGTSNTFTTYFPS